MEWRRPAKPRSKWILGATKAASARGPLALRRAAEDEREGRVEDGGARRDATNLFAPQIAAKLATDDEA